MINLINTKEILEEIKDILIEGEFTARWTLIETYHKVGQIIIENNLLPQRVAEYIGKSERTVEYMVKFASTYKDVNLLPEGKNISWRGVIREHLTKPKEMDKLDCDHKFRCVKCGEYE